MGNKLVFLWTFCLSEQHVNTPPLFACTDYGNKSLISDTVCVTSTCTLVSVFT